jgi:hypothetical protein
LCEAYGPYEYDSNEYYICTIFDGDSRKTEIAIDANTGDIVTDKDLVKYLIKHNLALYYLYDEESYNLNIQTADACRQNVDAFESDYEFWIDIRDNTTTQEQKQNAQEAADLCLAMKSIYGSKVNITTEIITIQTRIKSGGTLKDAEELIEAEEEAYDIEKQLLNKLNTTTNRFSEIYTTILNGDDQYGISESEWNTYKNDDMTFFEYEKDIAKSNTAYWEAMEKQLESDTQWYYESMLDRTTEADSSNLTPSFTFGLSIFALLVIGLFLSKSNRK